MTDKPFERRRRNSIHQPPDMSEDLRTALQDNPHDEAATSKKQYSELRIVLLGKTGSGKSSTGNTILGKEVFNMDSSFRSATVVCERGYRDLGDRIVTVIDTPGQSDTHSPDIVKEQIDEAMKLAYPGPNVFLLVIRLDVKFSEEEQNSVKWILETLGKEVRKHIMLLFTHGNELKGKTIEQFIQGHKAMSQEVARMAGYHVFENEQNDNNETQVTELLEKIDNLMNKNKNQMYTTDMYQKVHKKQPKQEESTSLGISDITEITGTAGVVGGGVGAAMLATGQDNTAAVIAVATACTLTAVALGVQKKGQQVKKD